MPSRKTCSPTPPRTLLVDGKVGNLVTTGVLNIVPLTAEHGLPTGVANYYNIELPNGEVVRDAAWYYPDCKVGIVVSLDIIASLCHADRPNSPGES